MESLLGAHLTNSSGWLIFSHASAKAERDLSSLYGVFLYVELGDSPGQDFMGPDQNATPLLNDSKFAHDQKTPLPG